MNVYFDTEFTGLQQETDLISIGLVSEDGQKFYAETYDFNWELIKGNKWIDENVIQNMLHTKRLKNKSIKIPEYYHYGKKAEIKKALEEWLSQFDDIQLISDVCHYDMVLFINIFGGAFDLPKNVSPVCHDINQDIAISYGISEREAFDKSREEILKERSIDIKGDKHNALYDALVIKEIYNIINKNVITITI